jgi:hypothetical protein
MVKRDATIQFAQLEFSKAELMSLPQPHLEFLLGSSLATNDIVVFRRLMLQLSHSKSECALANELAAANYSLIVRKLASAIIEYVNLLNAFCKRIHRVLENGASVLEEAEALVHRLRSEGPYSVAQWLRDYATHHFIAQKIAENLDAFDDDDEFHSYIHEMNGNSFFVAGEVIALQGLLKKHPSTSYNAFVKWVLDTSGELERFQQVFLIFLMTENFPDKKLIVTNAAVEPKFIASPEEKIGIIFDTRKSGAE